MPDAQASFRLTAGQFALDLHKVEARVASGRRGRRSIVNAPSAQRGVIVAVALALAVACQKPKPAPEPLAEATCAPTPSIATPLRLLTRFEYGNTVRDLLGDATGPQSAFPREPVVRGLDDDATVNQVSQEGLARYLEAAESLSSEVMQNRRSRVVPCLTDDQACRDAFLSSFGQRAFRRPLTQDEVALFASLFDAVKATHDFDTAAQWTVQAMLQSPQFLYRDETSLAQSATGRVALDDFRLATRLSYFLWGTTPDDALLSAAARGELSTDEGLARQANRLLDDPRALEGQLRFLSLWLNLDGVLTAEKDVHTYPAYTPALATAWRASLELFLRDVLRHGGTVEALFTSSALYANGAMSPYVGGGLPATEFQRVAMPPEQRAGVLTQPGLLARLSGTDQSSPIRRGAFVLGTLLCAPPPPPPSGASVAPPPVSPRSTTRQRFAAHGSVAPCSSCHAQIDPVGFTFEHYDGMGAWRDTENGQPIDATGGVRAADDPSLVKPVNGAVELSRLLAQSPQVKDCLAGELLRYALGRELQEGDTCSLAGVRKRFVEANGSFRALMLAIAQSDAFRGHAPVEVAP